MIKGLTESERELADRICERGAIGFGSFKLKLHEEHPGAPLSPIFFNLRKPPDGPLTNADIELICQEFIGILRNKKILFDVVAGIPKAGEPFAEIISQFLDRPLVKLGKKFEGDNRKIDSIVEGRYQSGQLVLLVDDLITHGHTKEEAIAVCEKAGLTISAIIFLIDREQGGLENLRREGYNIYAVFSLSLLFDYYVRVGNLDQTKRDEIMAYITVNRLREAVH